MSDKIEIYETADRETQIEVKFEEDTVWLNQAQIVKLFNSSKANISEHISSIYSTNELNEQATVRKFRTVQKEGNREVTRNIEHYNLDVIISVGYRVNTKRGIQFRQWASKRLKDYLIQGYAINEKRLEAKQQEVQYLKTGIRILNRAIEEQANAEDIEALKVFAKGLELLDDYDHEKLDAKGKTVTETIYPKVEEFLDIITKMKPEFSSDVFGQPKDNGFESSVKQIQQSFGGQELYPSLEEKASTLLYLIVKNHSFVDGNKRIGAACFLYFLDKNNYLYDENKQPTISNEALAALTLFVATSKPDEMEIVKKLIISILNRK